MLAEAPPVTGSMISGEWVLWCAPESAHHTWSAEWRVRSDDGFSLSGRLGDQDTRPLVSTAERDGIAVLVDGLVDDASWWRHHDGGQRAPADVVLAAYRAEPAHYLNATRGANVRVVLDGPEGVFVAARDPLGAQPLFYTALSGGVAVSPSIERLLALPGVSQALSRPALADHLCGRWPDPEETYYVAVRRVPAGHALTWRRNGPLRVTRYWDPCPAGQPVSWLKRDEIELFDRRFEQAVARCLIAPTTGVFLSGGLDSVSVAALAVDRRRKTDLPLPIAYSLGFPHADCDEEAIQKGVAAGLGMRSEFLRFDDAIGSRGLVEQALEIGATLPSPMMHTWSPAYSALATRARAQGVDVVLTGGGGDEWLAITPMLAADYIRSGNVAGLARFLAMWGRSYQLTPMGVLRGTLWRFGVRPLASMWLGRLAPDWWQRRRGQRLTAATPPWVAPDPALRALIDERAVTTMQPTDPREGFYLADVRRGMSHALTSMEFEESELFSRRHGLKTMRPFFDVDLVELLYRTPADLLTTGGRAKGLVRDAVARRFPTLGFERQKKRAATSFLRSLLRDQLPPIWERMGGAKTLVSLGIVDGRQVERLRKAAFSGTLDVRLYRAWSILNLEQWVRSRSNS